MDPTKRKTKQHTDHFIQIPTKLIHSPAFRVLGPSAKVLFMQLRTRFKGNNNGNISATLTDLAHLDWNSPSTLATALFELQAMGFLRKTRSGGIGLGKNVCSLYRFTDLDSQPFPDKGVAARKATFDYQDFTTLGQAKEARKVGVAKLRAEARGRSYPKGEQRKKTGGRRAQMKKADSIDEDEQLQSQ